MFENKIWEGIYYSRFVASWNKVHNGKFRRFEFEDWLMQLTINGKCMDNQTAKEICEFADNGKMELEDNARQFINNRVSRMIGED